MIVINKRTDELLKIDLSSSGITKRNPDKIRSLKEKEKEIKKYFNGLNINVKLILDTGFNSLGFIRISGDSIHIYDRVFFDIIKDDLSYVNVFYENDDVVFEIGYARLTK